MSARDDLINYASGLNALQSDFWDGVDEHRLDVLTDSELEDLQEYLNLRNAGFAPNEIEDMLGQEQVAKVLGLISTMNGQYQSLTRPRKAKKAKRRAAICDIEAVEGEEDETEFD